MQITSNSGRKMKASDFFLLKNKIKVSRANSPDWICLAGLVHTGGALSAEIFIYFCRGQTILKVIAVFRFRTTVNEGKQSFRFNRSDLEQINMWNQKDPEWTGNSLGCFPMLQMLGENNVPYV